MSRFRDAAVTRVDRRYGFTIEQAPDEAMHSRLYDDEEKHLELLSRVRWIAEEHAALFKRVWPMFPTGHCGVASLVLIEMLRASTDMTYRIAVGTAGHQDSIHVWIETTEGDIIDVSYGQFLSPEAAVNPVRVLHHEERRNLNHFAHRYLFTDEEHEARLSVIYEDNGHGYQVARSPVIKKMLAQISADKERIAAS